MAGNADRERIERIERQLAARKAAGDELALRLHALAATLAARELADLLIDECGYLGEHMPQFRESVAPFKCSGNTYHYCSFTAAHDPGCPAVGGDGSLTCGYDGATPCDPDCGETADEPWCHGAGFNCPTCEMVDALLGLIAREGIDGRLMSGEDVQATRGTGS